MSFEHVGRSAPYSRKNSARIVTIEAAREGCFGQDRSDIVKKCRLQSTHSVV